MNYVKPTQFYFKNNDFFLIPQEPNKDCDGMTHYPTHIYFGSEKIGEINLILEEFYSQFAEIRYSLIPEARGNGIMIPALSSYLSSLLSGSHHFEKIYLNIPRWNRASQNVAKNTGFYFDDGFWILNQEKIRPNQK